MTQIMRIFADHIETRGDHAAQAPALRVATMVSGANQREYLCRSVKCASSVPYK
jgi:hypothetical protein